MHDCLVALALMLTIEGALYALFPDGMRRMISSVMTLPTPQIRWTGLAAAVLGVVFVWLLRG